MVITNDITTLFHRARGMSRGDRDRFLAGIESRDPELAGELRSLLDASRSAGSYFDRLEGNIADAIEDAGPSEDADGTSMDDLPDLHPGARVGPYEIVERVGRGSMGIVYKARHVRMDRLAALKFLPARLGMDPQAKKRFVQEAKVLSTLEHPNLCAIFDIGETEGGALYLSMAYHEGVTLKKRLTNGALEVDEALAIALQVADGLAGAHRKGIVHQDVKPANIILTPNGAVKVVDFGVALVLDGAAGSGSAHPAMGTVAYMSPEQSRGDPVDARTDIWALGIVLYEMLSGSRPFGGGNPAEVLASIRQNDPEPLQSRVGDVRPSILSIVERCLKKDAEDRFQTTAALMADLHHAAKECTVRQADQTGQPAGLGPSRILPRSVYLSFRRGGVNDERLALAVRDRLIGPHRVFMERHGGIGLRWAETIDHELRGADFVIVVLSREALRDEMVAAELETARHAMDEAGGHPAILPVYLFDPGDIASPMDAYLAGLPILQWAGEEDTERVAASLRRVVDGAGKSPEEKKAIVRPRPDRRYDGATPSSDTLTLTDGALDPDSPYYVTRPQDALATAIAEGTGGTITIKGPRQTGKSSLLARVVRAAVDKGKWVASIDFQRIPADALRDPETFYPVFCREVAVELGMEGSLSDVWRRMLSPEQRCTLVLEREILKTSGAPILLALDRVDRMLEATFRSDFFGMLRSWHNARATRPQFRRLDLALVISTEPYELIEDLNRSPFNVGEIVELEGFTEEEVSDLNDRYGSPIPARRLPQLIEQVGTHPYLVHRAVSGVASGRYTAETLMTTAGDQDGPFGDHLRHHLFRVATDSGLRDAVLRVMRDGTCPSDSMFWRLRGAGLVVRRSGRIVLRTPLYERFFERYLA